MIIENRSLYGTTHPQAINHKKHDQKIFITKLIFKSKISAIQNPQVKNNFHNFHNFLSPSPQLVKFPKFPVFRRLNCFTVLIG